MAISLSMLRGLLRGLHKGERWKQGLRLAGKHGQKGQVGAAFACGAELAEGCEASSGNLEGSPLEARHPSLSPLHAVDDIANSCLRF